MLRKLPPALKIGALGIGLSLTALPLISTAALAQERPNILVIMGDDVGWFNVGAYHRGIMSGKTPNLDKLASEGMLFTDYYAEASCTAGRANFVTGELPIRTGMTTVGQAGADVGLPAEASTIATALRLKATPPDNSARTIWATSTSSCPPSTASTSSFGYLYHLDAMSDPYWYSFPNSADLSRRAAREILSIPGQPIRTITTVSRAGVQDRQAEDRRRRPARAVPRHVQCSEHAGDHAEGQVRHDDLR